VSNPIQTKSLMKKTFGIFLAVVLIVVVHAAEKLRIFKKDQTFSEWNVSLIDSLTFSNSTYLNVFGNGGTFENVLIGDLDSLAFTGSPDTIKIVFSSSSATITNPLADLGVSVTTSGADVVVNSTLTDNEVVYMVSGISTDGSLKLYSSFKCQLLLAGLSLTNADGPAINNQSKKRTTVVLASGTTNELTDASSYKSSTEDQKGTFFSEGQLIFKGSGSLSVKSYYGHAICSDDYIEVQEGTLSVTGAKKDGIHAKDHFNLDGGVVTLAATGDAVECESGTINIAAGLLTATVSSADTKGLKCDGRLTVAGGTVNMTVTGDQAKGFKSSGVMSFEGGMVDVISSGAAVLVASGSGYDPSYCTAIKCDSLIRISGGTLTVKSSGVGGKGISSDTDISITGGTLDVTNSGNGATYTNSLGVVDAYTGSGIDADGSLWVLGGNVTVTSSGTGANGLSADGAAIFGSESGSPTVKITNTGTRILISGTANYSTAVYAEPKGVKSDGLLTVNNGTLTVSVNQQNGEGLDCDSVLTINDGTVTITASGNASKGIEASDTLSINGGVVTVKTSGAAVLETSGSGYDPSYCSGIKSSNQINLNGGSITINGTGVANKGITADGNIAITNAVINVTETGAGASYTNSSGTTDTYFCTAIKADKDINIQTGTITVDETGSACKGISADGTLTVGSTVNSPIINVTTNGAGIAVSGSGNQADYSISKGMKGTTAFVINNGTLTVQSTGSSNGSGGGEGMESFAMTINGGTISLSASDDCLSITKGGETMSGSDGSSLIVNGGYLVANSSVGDAIDSNGNISMTGGTFIIHGPTSSPEEGVDFNGSFVMTGGYLIASGSNSNMNQALSTGSTQCNFYVLSSSQIASGTLFNIQDSEGNSIVTFKPARAYYSILFCSPSLKTGTTYKIYTGGSSTGTLKDGIYTEGVYSPGTLKKTVTTSTTSKVNKVTF
jgi:trimeric autotransporter adhesin